MSAPRTAIHQPWPGLIAAYRDRLPVGDDWTPVTLFEGGTPLIPAPRLSEKTGCTVHLKVEGLNPTGSFKDRGMTMAVTDALARGQKAVLCASTGNTSASAAAYAARAGITCAVLIPTGKIAMGKLAQAVMHGAKIIQIDGNFDDCLELARKMTNDFPTISLVNSVNPVRIEGQKTAAFEIVDALGTAPDIHALPVGNAGNITAYWRGYSEYHRDGIIDKLPRMLGTQAAGAAPLVHGEPVANPETIATAIRIGAPASWTSAVEAQQQSNGRFLAATEDVLHQPQRAPAMPSSAEYLRLLRRHSVAATLSGAGPSLIALSTEPELPAEAVEYGTANGFIIKKMTVGDGVRWKPGVTVAG